MRRPRAITVRWLKRHDACEDQFEKFRQTFGDRAELTRGNALLAASAGLDLDWLASRLLSVASLLVYEEAVDPAWQAFRDAKYAAWRAYEEARHRACRWDDQANASREAYVKDETAAWRVYQEATAAARRAFNEVAAIALCDQLGLPKE